MTDITFQDLYTAKIDNLSLRDALDLHYKLNPQFHPWYTYQSQYAKNMLKAHDISHVISGCDTSFEGEVLVQVWTFLNAKLPMEHFWEYYNDKESQVLLNPTNKSRIFLEFILNTFKIFKLWIRSFKLKKKWVYFEEEKWMDKTIGEIRKEYGIVLAK